MRRDYPETFVVEVDVGPNNGFAVAGKKGKHQEELLGDTGTRYRLGIESRAEGGARLNVGTSQRPTGEADGNREAVALPRPFAES